MLTCKINLIKVWFVIEERFLPTKTRCLGQILLSHWAAKNKENSLQFAVGKTKTKT